MATSRSLEEFRQRMHVVAQGVAGEVGRIVRKTALAVDQGAVMATPVDTGRARANWAVSTGAAAGFEPVKVDSPIGEAEATQKALDHAGTVIGAYRLADGTIYITNNVPYIGPLEHGSSSQAPKCMLADALQAGRQVVKRERIRIT